MTTGYGMEVMESGWMFIMPALFICGFIVSWVFGGMGVDLIEKPKN